jgi:hypothetical protein
MKLVKSLMLGSAAGLIAMSGAQAADLPVKAKAVEYVKVCSLYGAGFYYIPGTDTCIKLGGYLRVDTTFNASGVQNNPAWSGDSGQGNRYRDTSCPFPLALTIDTRTATEYGVVRTFSQVTSLSTPWGRTTDFDQRTSPVTARTCSTPPAAAMSRSKWCSSSSPASPSVSLLRLRDAVAWLAGQQHFVLAQR